MKLSADKCDMSNDNNNNESSVTTNRVLAELFTESDELEVPDTFIPQTNIQAKFNSLLLIPVIVSALFLISLFTHSFFAVATILCLIAALAPAFAYKTLNNVSLFADTRDMSEKAKRVFAFVLGNASLNALFALLGFISLLFV